MELVLTEDQQMIAETAADFAADRSPITRFRELREAGDDVGFSRALWKEMAELGWLGIAFPESVGGAGMGFAELALVMEQAGRQLAPEPLLSCAVLGGRALLHAGTEAHQKEWLQPLIEGERLVALAAQEPNSRWSLSKVATAAKPSGEGWQISGTKSQVLDGHVADAFVVSARTKGNEEDDDGVALFLVPADAPGVNVERQHRLDDRGAALPRDANHPAQVGLEVFRVPIAQQVVASMAQHDHIGAMLVQHGGKARDPCGAQLSRDARVDHGATAQPREHGGVRLGRIRSHALRETVPERDDHGVGAQGVELRHRGAARDRQCRRERHRGPAPHAPSRPLKPGPRTTRPGNSPVCSPSRNTAVPFTNT